MTHGALDVRYGSEDWRARLLSNLARTPFTVDGVRVASVEAFWQGLKYPEGPERDRVFRLWGHAARRARETAPGGETFRFRGRVYVAGSAEHKALLQRAIREKFRQNRRARAALLATGALRLTHRLGGGVLTGEEFAATLMAVRDELRGGEPASGRNRVAVKTNLGGDAE